MRLHLAFLLLVSAAWCGAAERPLLVIFDESYSMRQNDPHRYAGDAAQLVVATFRADKQLAMIGFSDDAEILVPWGKLVDAPTRVRVSADLADRLSFNGSSTHYVKALDLGYKMLDEVQAPATTRVIFFTDGEPDDTSAAVAERAQRFAKRGWVIEGIRLNPNREKTATDLVNLATVTRGGYREVVNASNLVTTFLELANAEGDSFALDSAAIDPTQPLPLPGGADLLAYISVKGDSKPKGWIDGVRRDGAAVPMDPATVFRYPPAADARSHRGNLDVVSLFNVQAGNYSPVLDGVPRGVYVAVSLQLRVEPLPIPPRIAEGQPLALGVRVTWLGDAERGKTVLAALKADATVTDTLTTDRLTSGAMAAGPIQGNSFDLMLPWTAALTTTADRSQPHPLEITYQLNIDRRFRLTKRDATVVDPQLVVQKQPAVVQFAQPNLALPPVWVGESRRGSIPVEVTGVSEALRFTAAAPFSFPDALPVPAHNSQLAVAVEAAAPGHFTAHGATSGLKDELRTPELSVDAYRWVGRPDLALTGPGATPLATWCAVEPGTAAQPLAEVTAPLAGPEGKSLVATVQADGNVRFAADWELLPAGVYHGTATLGFGALPPRQVQLSYRHQPVTKWTVSGEGWANDPAEKRDGWTGFTRSVVPQGGRPGSVTARFSELIGPGGERLEPGTDLRAEIIPGKVIPGEPANVRVRVCRGEDMPGGDYRGQIELVLTPDDGGEPQVSSLPLTVSLP